MRSSRFDRPDGHMSDGREPTAPGQRPEGYVEPTSVWCVEYIDLRRPSHGTFQVGAFTSQIAAEELLRRLTQEDFFAGLRVIFSCS